jgi:hypothetical protein
MHKPSLLLLYIFLLFTSSSASAFCGFYVARADQSLYNDASQVVLVRDGNRTVITMNSNFRGDVDEFAIVIPVPTLLEEGQINVAERTLVEHLDAYTAPRLVEYFDEDPCQMLYRAEMMQDSAMAPGPTMRKKARAKNLGVTIEAEYAIGEYDILILSATQSGGLTTWLQESGYKIPPGAAPTIRSYIKQGMKFFVAKVNLATQEKLGYTYLRPIQIAFESPKFMLPIRLGMVNADGPQDMYVYALSRNGRVETQNYRTVKIPTGMDLPVKIKDDFGNFYKAMFDKQYAANNRNVAFLEYAWDMAWCDPCAADPLTPAQLRQLGVFWVGENQNKPMPRVQPALGRPLGPSLGPSQQAQPRRIMPPQAVDVFVTRLHVRYDNEHFPEDLMFVETGDKQNFQGRYVIRHAWEGEGTCPQAKTYREKTLPQRQSEEAKRLANLTGWSLEGPTGVKPVKPAKPPQWWEKLWQDS